VPLKIADLCPGRPIPGELDRLRHRGVARRRAADDRGGALTARAARPECVGIGVLHLGLTGRDAGAGLWTNDECDRVLAVPGGRVGGDDRGQRHGDRERPGAHADEATPISGYTYHWLSVAEVAVLGR